MNGNPEPVADGRAPVLPGAVRGDGLDLLAALLAAGLLAMSHYGGPSLPRILLTVGFTFFVPGRAIVTNWPAMARWSGAAMSMVLSLAALALLATVTLWAHFWHPIGLFQAEAGLSLAGLAVGLARRPRSGPGSPQGQPGAPSRGGTR